MSRAIEMYRLRSLVGAMTTRAELAAAEARAKQALRSLVGAMTTRIPSMSKIGLSRSGCDPS